MKPICWLPICLILLTSVVMANPNPEIDALQAIRDAGELAFERNDINTIETLWVRDGDALMTTPLGTQHQGFAEIKRALLALFALLGQTTIEASDLFFTLLDDEASITMKYTWNVVPGTLFDVTERYRKVDGHWKIYRSDSQGNTLPLRPDDEKAIKQLALRVQASILAKDIKAIAFVVADDFTYTDIDGIPHPGWQKSVETLRADFHPFVDLQLQSIVLIANTACGRYTLTHADGNTRPVQFTFAGPQWRLAAIHLKPQVDPFAVMPNGKRFMTWGRLKK